MQYALNALTIRACPRPVGEKCSSGDLWPINSHIVVDRKVVFTSKVPDPNSGRLKLVDSTCGYSPMWLLQNMFTEQCYVYEVSIFGHILLPYFTSSSQTIDILRQKQVPQFEALIGKPPFHHCSM